LKERSGCLNQRGSEVILHFFNRRLAISVIAYLAGFGLLWMSFLGSKHELLKEILVGPIGLAPWSISPVARGVLFGSSILFLTAGYFLSIRWAFREDVTPLGIRKARLFVTFLLILFLFLPTFLDFDIISYYQQGWVVAYQKANPYFVSPGDFPSAPGKDLIHEINLYALSPYGPFWTEIEGVIYRMSHGSLWLGIFLFKLLATGASLILTFLIAKVARVLSPKHEIVSLIFLGAHPLLLVEGPGMAHVDVLALTAIALGIYLQMCYRGRVWIGALFSMIGILVKAYSIPCLFLFFWWLIRDGKTLRIRCLQTTQAVIPAAVLFAIVSIPYIGSLSDIPRLLAYSSSKLTLPFTPVSILGEVLFQGIGWKTQGLGLALGFVAVLLILYRTYSLEDACTALGPVYLVVNLSFSYWRQWYALWPLALVAVFPSRKWAWVIAAYCWLALCSLLVTSSSGISPFR
jgi:hypothetical protein